MIFEVLIRRGNREEPGEVLQRWLLHPACGLQWLATPGAECRGEGWRLHGFSFNGNATRDPLSDVASRVVLEPLFVEGHVLLSLLEEMSDGASPETLARIAWLKEWLDLRDTGIPFEVGAEGKLTDLPVIDPQEAPV